MKEIKKDNILYAVYAPFEFQEGSIWYGDAKQALQVQRMGYHTGKCFKLHRHKFRLRQTEYTQECFVIVQGCLLACLYDDNKEFIAGLTLTQGDMLIVFKGWHEFYVKDNNTVCYEIKNGPFTTIEEDKEY